jgi:outer membrane protein TolC
MVLSGLTFQRVTLRAVFAIVMLVFFGSLRAQSNSIAGTLPEDYLPELKEILATALKRSPDVIAKEFDRLVQEARLIQVRAAQLPSVGGNFNYGITQTATAGAGETNSQKSKDDGFFYNFGINQAIFHWGALKNQTLAARINVLVTEKAFAVAYRELSVMLRKSYLALIVEKARLNQVRELLRLANDDVAVATARKELGVISAAELEGEKLRVRERELDVGRADADFTANRERFARLAGLPNLTEDKVGNDIPRPAYSETQTTLLAATVLKENARSTLEYEIYELRIREAVLRQKIESTRLLPKFGANASYNLENTTNVIGNIAQQRAVARQSVSIGGNWAIFDGFATKGAKREALVARRSLEHKKAAEIDQLLQTVQGLERTLKLDAEQLAVSDIHRGLADEAQKQISEEVRLGNLARVDMDRAQLSILQANAQNLASRAAYLGHWSEFVAVASDDPVLTSLPARYASQKK